MLSSSAPTPLPPVTLVLGGARSGKSAFAEALIETAGPGIYLATATAGDADMADRIRLHRERRGDRWTTLEEPLDIGRVLVRHARPDRPILVDCLTLWLSNIMAARRDVEAEMDALAAGARGLAGPVVFVSNEVGLGIVPSTGLGRRFRDLAGRLNQTIAGVADRVVFMVASQPMVVKDAPS